MKKKSSISLGPGAPSLILIFVVLSMSVLAMLALMSARNDLSLSVRSAEVAEIVYGINEKAEERRGELEGILAACAEEAADGEDGLRLLEQRLPEGVSLEDGMLVWTETEAERSLECALALESFDSRPRTAWVRHRLVTEIFEETEELWD